MCESNVQSILTEVYKRQFPKKNFDWDAIKSDDNFRIFRCAIEKQEVSGLSWIELCRLVHKIRKYKSFLFLLIILIEQHLIDEAYLIELNRLLPMLQKVANSVGGSKWNAIFCGKEIRFLSIIPSKHKSANYMFIQLSYANPYLRSEVNNFLTVTNSHNQNFVQMSIGKRFITEFELSLGNLNTFNNFTGFTENTFWQQTNYFKKICSNDDAELDISLRLLCCFYRFLVNQYPEHDFFANALHMSEAILFTKRTKTFLKEDYTIIPYGDIDLFPGNGKFVLILKGYQSESTRIKKNDFITLDISMVTNQFLQTELLLYLTLSMPLCHLASICKDHYLSEALVMFEKLKAKPNYPNPSLAYYTRQEALLLMNFFNDKRLALDTRNNKIGVVRRFFLWEKEERHHMEFEDMFFDYLRQYEQPSPKGGNAIPDDDLGTLSSFMAEKASEDPKANLAYAAFHIALETEFRISQILSLTVDCIEPSSKPNEYIVRSFHKTGHGEKTAFTITELTYRHLMRIIADTDPLRDNCTIQDLKNYIFLYKGLFDSVTLMQSRQFRDYFQKCCIAVGIPAYNSKNIRDSHMTKSFEYILRHGKSDLLMSKFSNHRRIDTTKNSYIEQRLDEMLEATYGIIIGSLDDYYNPAEHIKDKIPDDINCIERVVRDGCGNCAASTCSMPNRLDCLACKDFITTVEHEPYFKHAIEEIDTCIRQSSTKHDKDDIATIKLLLVMYLKAIYLKKENEHD